MDPHIRRTVSAETADPWWTPRPNSVCSRWRPTYGNQQVPGAL